VLQLRQFATKWLIPFYNVQFVYKYYRIEKKNNILCFECCPFLLPSCQFLAAFSQVLFQSPQSPIFIRKFHNTLFCSIASNDVHIVDQNLIFVAETYMFTSKHQSVVCYHATYQRYRVVVATEQWLVSNSQYLTISLEKISRFSWYDQIISADKRNRCFFIPKPHRNDIA